MTKRKRITYSLSEFIDVIKSKDLDKIKNAYEDIDFDYDTHKTELLKQSILTNELEIYKYIFDKIYKKNLIIKEELIIFAIKNDKSWIFEELCNDMIDFTYKNGMIIEKTIENKYTYYIKTVYEKIKSLQFYNEYYNYLTSSEFIIKSFKTAYTKQNYSVASYLFLLNPFLISANEYKEILDGYIENEYNIDQSIISTLTNNGAKIYKNNSLKKLFTYANKDIFKKLVDDNNIEMEPIQILKAFSFNGSHDYNMEIVKIFIDKIPEVDDKMNFVIKLYQENKDNFTYSADYIIANMILEYNYDLNKIILLLKSSSNYDNFSKIIKNMSIYSHASISDLGKNFMNDPIKNIYNNIGKFFNKNYDDPKIKKLMDILYNFIKDYAIGSKDFFTDKNFKKILDKYDNHFYDSYVNLFKFLITINPTYDFLKWYDEYKEHKGFIRAIIIKNLITDEQKDQIFEDALNMAQYWERDNIIELLSKNNDKYKCIYDNFRYPLQINKLDDESKYENTNIVNFEPCMICMDDSKKHFVKYECNHYFCKECMINSSKTCQMCLSNIKYDKISLFKVV